MCEILQLGIRQLQLLKVHIIKSNNNLYASVWSSRVIWETGDVKSSCSGPTTWKNTPVRQRKKVFSPRPAHSDIRGFKAVLSRTSFMVQSQIFLHQELPSHFTFMNRRVEALRRHQVKSETSLELNSPHSTDVIPASCLKVRSRGWFQVFSHVPLSSTSLYFLGIQTEVLELIAQLCSFFPTALCLFIPLVSVAWCQSSVYSSLLMVRRELQEPIWLHTDCPCWLSGS